MNPNPRAVFGAIDLTAAPYMLDVEVDRGTPENVYEAVLGSLVDGEVIASNRTSNREIVLTVHIDTADSADWALREQALMLEAERRRNTLTLTPGDGVGEATVFDTFRAQLTPINRGSEEYDTVHSYTLTIPALPFPRPDELTVTPAIPAPPATVTTTTVDDCTTTAGWSSSPAGVAASGGAVGVNSGLNASQVTLSRTGAITLTGTPYLVVRSTLEQQSGSTVTVNPSAATTWLFAGGVDLQAIAAVAFPGGWIEYYFNLTGLTIGSGGISVYSVWTNASRARSATLRIDQVRKTSHLPVVSRRQQTRAVDVGGSAPTEGSIHLSHAAGPLGEVLAFTYPRELVYQPPQSTNYVSGGGSTVADSTRLSGQYRSLTSPVVFDIPAGALPPGTYTVAASLYATTTGGAKPLDLTVQSRMAGANVGPAWASNPVPVMTLDAWRVYLLDQINIPTPVGTAGTVRVTLGRNAATSTTVYLDELLLFHTSGALTLLNYAGKHVWIDAPSLDQPTGGLWVGNLTDRSDQWSALGTARHAGRHTFTPNGTQLYTACDGSDDMLADITHYRRYHSRVVGA